MIDSINQIDNKGKIAIVVVGYNRIKSISRLLDSLLCAKYPSNDIPLVISIDCSGDEELYSYVRTFEWPFGEKYVNIQTERLGLKKHIFQCGDLSEYFKAVIILEDDSYVSPYFYHYANDMVVNYGQSELICGISLYVSHTNEFVSLPFFPLSSGKDFFLLQDTQTRGECFTYYQWKKFRDWLTENEDRDYMDVPMPERIKTWKRAWSKAHNAYMVENHLYFIYPYVSFVTNMGAVGEHSDNVSNVAQVCLEWGHKDYKYVHADQLIRYDCFSNNEDTYKWLNLSREELCLDYYGFNPNIQNKRYVLTYKNMPYKVIKTWGLSMYPIEINVMMNIEGKDLFLYDTTQNSSSIKSIPYGALDYIYCKHLYKNLYYYLYGFIRQTIKSKIKRLFHK